MTRFVAWMRVISPAERVVALSIAGCFGFGGLMAMAEVLESGVGPAWASGFEAARGVIALVALLGACVYGALRAAYFHPLCRRSHYQWLLAAPWDVSRALPFGPITLAPQDLVWLAVFGACAGQHGLLWAVAACLLAIGAYLTVATALLLRAGPYWAGYVLVLLAGLLMQLYVWRWAQFLAELRLRIRETHSWFFWSVTAVMLTMIAVSQFALRRQLSRFPWPAEMVIEWLPRGAHQQRTRNQRATLGWPLDTLRPGSARDSAVSAVERVALSLCIGWLAMVFGGGALIRELMMALASDDGSTDIRLAPAMPMLLAMVFPLFRLVDRTVLRTRAPMSALGRWSVGRAWIPGFDQVWVAPLASIALVLAGALVIRTAPPLAELVAFTVTTSALLIHFFAPPSEAVWQLTGSHRLAPSSANSWAFRAPRDRFWN